MRASFEVRRDNVTGPAIRQLMREHLEEMFHHSPPGSVHALDLSELQGPDMTMWSVWEGSLLVGCGGLRQHDAIFGEVKAMRTASSHLRRGIGALILQTIMDEARSRGLVSLGLETGTPEVFEPARRLYVRFGFRPCPPFPPYRRDPFSMCMRIGL